MRKGAMLISTLFLVLGLSPAVLAQVYKCTDATGRTVYSQIPCETDAEAVNLQGVGSATEGTSRNSTGLRPAEAERLLKIRIREEARRREREIEREAEERVKEIEAEVHAELMREDCAEARFEVERMAAQRRSPDSVLEYRELSARIKNREQWIQANCR